MEGKRDAKTRIETLEVGFLQDLVRKSFVGTSCYVVTAVVCAVVTVICYRSRGDVMPVSKGS